MGTGLCTTRQRFASARRSVRLVLPLLLVIALFLLLAEQTSATDGTVTVTATNTAKITISISDATAAFGANLAPDGTGTAGEITSVLGNAGNQGAYYVWTPSSLPLVSVKSNKVWNGTIAASENPVGGGASATMKIANSSLRHGTAAPATYADAASGTAFTVATAVWENNKAKGKWDYSFYYFLKVDWDDDPGAFASTVTYSVTQ